MKGQAQAAIDLAGPFDIEADALNIESSLGGNGIILKDGATLKGRDVKAKTERGRRTLVIPAEAIAALREHRVRQARERLAAGASWDDGDFVFTTQKGRPLDGVHVTHDFQAALERAGLPRQRFHDLRHAHATLLIEGGVELAVVSRALGHSDLGTTADVYGSWTRDMAGRVASHMDSVLRPRTAAG